MGEPARKLAKQKSTGQWLVVEDPGDGKWRKVDALADEPEHWTGEQYDLVRANAGKDPWLKEAADWYGANMIDEPSGPLDENGKTTATAQPLKPANDNAAPTAPPQPAAAPAAPATEQSPWAAFAAASKRLGSSVASGIGDAFSGALQPMPGEEEQERANREEAGDFLRGVGQGFTFRWGDVGAAKLESALPRPAVYDMRAAGRGGDAPLMTEDEQDEAVELEALGRERAANEESRERSPWAYGVGEVAGAMPAAIATAPAFGTGGAAAAAVPWRALALRNAAQGAALGAVTGAGGGEEGSRLSDAAMGAGAGAAGGAMGSALGSGIGAGARWAGDKIDDVATAARSTPQAQWLARKAENLANRSRAAATGAYGAQLKQMSKDEGFDYVDDTFGAEVENLFPPETGRFGLPKPRTARDYAELAGPKADEIGVSIDDTLRALDEQGVSAPVLPTGYGDEVALVDPIDSAIGKYSRPMRIGGDDKVMATTLRGIRDEAVGAAGDKPRLTPTQLAEMKRSLEGSGYASEATKGLPAGVMREANRAASAGPREALRDAVRQQAEVGTAARFQRLNQQYPVAKKVAELAEGRAAQEQGNQIVSLPGAIATSAMGPAAAAPVAGWEMVKRYGADATANAARGVQRAAQLQLGPRVAPSPVLQQAAQTAGARAGVPWGALARRGQPAMAEPGEPQQSESTRQQRAETSMGHNLQRDVQNALRAYPQALGPFKEQLKAVEKDPVALSAAISDLMNDERFQNEVVPQLEAVKGYRR
jgi:hypothetical protein